MADASVAAGLWAAAIATTVVGLQFLAISRLRRAFRDLDAVAGRAENPALYWTALPVVGVFVSFAYAAAQGERLRKDRARLGMPARSSAGAIFLALGLILGLGAGYLMWIGFYGEFGVDSLAYGLLMPAPGVTLVWWPYASAQAETLLAVRQALAAKPRT